MSTTYIRKHKKGTDTFSIFCRKQKTRTIEFFFEHREIKLQFVFWEKMLSPITGKQFKRIKVPVFWKLESDLEINLEGNRRTATTCGMSHLTRQLV